MATILLARFICVTFTAVFFNEIQWFKWCLTNNNRIKVTLQIFLLFFAQFLNKLNPNVCTCECVCMWARRFSHNKKLNSISWHLIYVFRSPSFPNFQRTFTFCLSNFIKCKYLCKRKHMCYQNYKKNKEKHIVHLLKCNAFEYRKKKNNFYFHFHFFCC